MAIQRYSVNQYQVEALLTWIKTYYIAIPEIQRPFVWNAVKVSDFIDSLYRGYPVENLAADCIPSGMQSAASKATRSSCRSEGNSWPPR